MMTTTDRANYLHKINLPENKKTAVECINQYLGSSQDNLKDAEKFLDDYIENTNSGRGDAEGNLYGAVEEILNKVYTAYESLDIVIKKIKEIEAN